MFPMFREQTVETCIHDLFGLEGRDSHELFEDHAVGRRDGDSKDRDKAGEECPNNRAIERAPAAPRREPGKTQASARKTKRKDPEDGRRGLAVRPKKPFWRVPRICLVSSYYDAQKDKNQPSQGSTRSGSRDNCVVPRRRARHHQSHIAKLQPPADGPRSVDATEPSARFAGTVVDIDPNVIEIPVFHRFAQLLGGPIALDDDQQAGPHEARRGLAVRRECVPVGSQIYEQAAPSVLLVAVGARPSTA